MIRNRVGMYISSVSRDLVANSAYFPSPLQERDVYSIVVVPNRPRPTNQAKQVDTRKTLTTKTGYCRRHLSYKEKKEGPGRWVPRTGCRGSAVSSKQCLLIPDEL